MPQGFNKRVIGGLLAAIILLIIWRTSQYQQLPFNPSIIQGHHSDTNTPDTKNSDVKIPDVKIPDVKIPGVKIPDVNSPDPDVKTPDVKTGDTKPEDTRIEDTKTEKPKTEEPKTVEFPRRRIGKVSMLYGFQNTYYEHALESHQRHADRWNYPMHVLEEDISAGYWNKPSYVLSLVIQELAKPPEDRLEWLMWVYPL